VDADPRTEPAVNAVAKQDWVAGFPGQNDLSIAMAPDIVVFYAWLSATCNGDPYATVAVNTIAPDQGLLPLPNASIPNGGD
jgi:hypothetical protein